MAGYETENFIKFDDLIIAAAYARMTGKNFKWVAADSEANNSFIYGYCTKPERGGSSRTAVWSYAVNDKQSQDKEYKRPIGIYTGNIPWHHTLRRTIME